VDEVVNASEGFIGRRVSVAAIIPSFDDAHVVSEGDECRVGKFNSGNGVNEELETNCFGPTDVSLSSEGLPVWMEAPCSPSVTDDNADAKRGAGIGKGRNVGIIWGNTDVSGCEVG